MMSGLRKTRRRFEVPHQARFLTFSCYQRLPLFQNDSIKRAFVDQLTLTRERLGFKLFAWVLMPEHVHVVLIPDLMKADVPRILMGLKRPFAKRVLDRWRELDAAILARIKDHSGAAHFWQAGGGYDRNLDSPKQMESKIDYCHANPVTRGLVDHPGVWPWSSFRWYHGLPDAFIEMDRS